MWRWALPTWFGSGNERIGSSTALRCVRAAEDSCYQDRLEVLISSDAKERASRAQNRRRGRPRSLLASIPATMPDRPWWGEFVRSGSSAVLAYVFTNLRRRGRRRMAIQSTTTRKATRRCSRRSTRSAAPRASPACSAGCTRARSGSFRTSRSGSASTVSSSQPPRRRRRVAAAAVLAVARPRRRARGLAALVSNPFFIVKTRLQATSTDAALAVGQQHASGAAAASSARWRRSCAPTAPPASSAGSRLRRA